VCDALTERGYRVLPLDVTPDLVATLRAEKPDAVYIALHGKHGEDGTVQGLLELLGLPYVGSGVLASALAMDKVVSKVVFEAAGLRTPGWQALRSGGPVDIGAVIDELGGKLVVKPVSEGSSVGMSIVHEPAELPAAIDLAFRHDSTVLVERYVTGVEVTVGVVGNDELTVLPTLEIVPEHEYYDYDSKYVPGMSRHIIPARVSDTAREECARMAEEAHRVLGCRGVSRADMIVAEGGEVFLLEVNTIPGMTSTSLLPDAARAAGIEFPELCSRLVDLALER
jgi:D-alanine-D-alanine ligase